MKLKTRLITAFFVITCVPVLFTVLAFVGVSHMQLNSLEEKLGLSNVNY